jgi:hypothetical protein
MQYCANAPQDTENTDESADAVTLNDVALYEATGTDEDLSDFTDATTP